MGTSDKDSSHRFTPGGERTCITLNPGRLSEADMAELNRRDGALRESYPVGTTVVTPLPAERAYPLKNSDFLTLCDGVNGREKEGRDRHIEIFITAVVGICGVLSCTDWPTVFAQRKCMALASFLTLLIIAAASGYGGVLHWNRIRQEETACSRLKKSISAFFQDKMPP